MVRVRVRTAQRMLDVPCVCKVMARLKGELRRQGGGGSDAEMMPMLPHADYCGDASAWYAEATPRLPLSALQVGEPLRRAVRRGAARGGAALRGPGGPWTAPSPARHGAQSGEQVLWTARLGQVVVRAHIQPAELILFFAPCGQHDDWYVVGCREAPQMSTHFQTRPQGQHPVQKDRIGCHGQRQIDRFLAITRHNGIVTCAAQIVVQKRDNGLLVFNDHWFVYPGRTGGTNIRNYLTRLILEFICL